MPGGWAGSVGKGQCEDEASEHLSWCKIAASPRLLYSRDGRAQLLLRLCDTSYSYDAAQQQTSYR